MRNAFVSEKQTLKTKSLIAFIAIVAAVALPQVFHVAGVLSGTETMPGRVFLPMHIPVFIAGFLAGPLAGIAAGLFSPIFSFLFTSAIMSAPMPVAAQLPFMCAELAGFGLVAGLLYKNNMPVIAKLILAQVGGRLLRAVIVITAVGVFSSEAVTIESIWTTVQVGLPGILLQWAFIPLIIYRLKGQEK